MLCETKRRSQLQIDFCSTMVQNGEEVTRGLSSVSTLAIRRREATVCLRKPQSAWQYGLESASLYFGDLPHDVLLENARAMLNLHPTRGMSEVSEAHIHIHGTTGEPPLLLVE